MLAGGAGAFVKILCVTNHFPLPRDNGAAGRIYPLLRELSREHQVHLLAARRHDTEDAHIEAFRAALPVEVEVFDAPRGVPTRRAVAALWSRSLLRRMPPWVLDQHSPRLRERLRELAPSVDAVVILDDYAGSYVGAADGTPVIIDKHNVLLASTRAEGPIERTLKRRMEHHLLEVPLTRSFERRAVKGADAVVVTSADEAERLRRLHGRDADAVVPSAVDLPAAPVRGGDPKVVGWLGALDWRANVDGLVRFVESAWEPLGRDGFQLLVAGRSPDPSLSRLERFEGVQILGYVERLEDFFGRVGAAVVPLWDGPGVKLKTVTLMGAGLPTAATPVALEGVAAEDGTHCLVAQDPQGLGEALRRIAADAALAERLATEGRDLIARHHTWDQVTPRFAEVVVRTAS
jgi:glycosyltransferase involved in cell wall biosynthesis